MTISPPLNESATVEASALAAERLSPRSARRSIGRNALSDYRSRNFKQEIVSRIVKSQRERAAMSVAPVAQQECFAQLARALEVSVRVV